jgi:hypothetical protein
MEAARAELARSVMEEARTELFCHRSYLLRPPLPVSSSPRPRRRRHPTPLGPRRRHPLTTAPPISLVHRAPTGPTGGRAGNDGAQRGAKRVKPRFLSSPPPNRSRKRVFWLLLWRSCLGCPLAHLHPKQLPKLLCQMYP